MADRELGRVAYEAYATERKWVAANGDPIPPWAEQDHALQIAWNVAAMAVVFVHTPEE